MIRTTFCLSIIGYLLVASEKNIPIVLTTWSFTNSTERAWEVLKDGGTSLDAIEQGASVCEEQQCDGTVGFGGSPDEDGETTLDALIMDGKTMNVGAVGALRRVKSAISVARHVLEHTKHSFLVGEQATQFAVQMGFKKESLTTIESKRLWKKWHNEENCQPNFWIDVKPDSKQHCGPYTQLKNLIGHDDKTRVKVDRFNHDTIGMVAIDNSGNIAAGTSTNGAKFKIPGLSGAANYFKLPFWAWQCLRRIGDSPIPGSGAYADNAVGGAAATGDGDVMLRFLPSFLAVEEMRRGATPEKAAKTAIERIILHYPTFMGAVVALTKDGKHGASCHGIDKFPYIVRDKTQNSFQIVSVQCSNLP